MSTYLILHGWGHSSDLWKEIADKLESPEFNVIALDLPGFGSEPLVSSDWGVPEYAQWVKSKISELKLTDVILLGHSFGGRIASLIASENPKWLKALILYAAPSIYRPSFKIRLKIARNKVLKRLGFKKTISKNTELQNADEKGLGQIFRKVVPFDQTHSLKEIKVPTLIIWPENDKETSLNIGKEMHTLIPNSKLVILENAGHNVYLENPNIFYGTVKNYIENLK